MSQEDGRLDAVSKRRNELEPFLREAPGIVLGLERSLSLLGREPQAGGDRGNEGLSGLSLLSHRLYGSASLYGLDTVAQLAGAIETAVNQLVRSGDDVGEAVHQLLTNAVAAAGDAVLAAREGRVPTPPSQDLLSRLEALAVPPSPEGRDDLATVLRRQATINPDVLDFFEPEAREQLDGLSSALATLASGHDQEAVNTAFRLVHTLKGAALMVECEPIGRLAHEMESLLEQAQTGKVLLDEGRLAVLEDAHDVLLAMVAALGGRRAPLSDANEEIHRRLAGLTKEEAPPRVPTPPPTARPAVEAEDAVAGAATEQGARGPVDADPVDPPPVAPASVNRASADPASVKRASVNPALGDPVAFGTDSAESGPLDSETRDSEHVERIPVEPDPADDAATRRIRVSLDRVDTLSELAGQAKASLVRLEHLVKRLDEAQQQYAVSRARLFETVEAFERRGKALLLEPGKPDAPAEAGENADASEPSLAETSELSLDGFSELELDRYDEVDVLMRQLAEISYDLGETQGLTSSLRTEMTSEIERSTRLSRELQNSIRRTRLLPLGRLLERFRRRAERAASEAGKEVVVQITGGEVEVDAAIVERLVDPLLHLVSNAVVHGIEGGSARRVQGKARHGTIGLHARVHGAFVELEVEDDGRGLDLDALRRRAVENGLWTEAEAKAKSPAEVQALIFERGMSTADRVSDTAGRGIGMDVVRATVRELNGEVRTETMEGVGTRFTLRLPVMVTASSALQLRVGQERFALPPMNVRRVLQVERRRVVRRGGREWISLDEEELQVIRLADHLGIAADDPPPDNLALLVVQPSGIESAPLAVVIDELLGFEELVMQPLCGVLSGIVGFAGVTLTPDGRVVLVLDPADLSVESSLPAWSRSETQDAAVAERPRLLIADDSVSVRGVLARQLTAAGYEVITAQDGEQALLELRAQRFDALITDIEMPRLNGFELLELVRRRPVGYDLPVIVVTTRIGGRHRELAERLGATAYFSKPINRSSLLEILARVTAPRHHEQLDADLETEMEAS